jgi:L-rhamnose mutarotase
MKRYAFKLKLKPGCVAEYKRRHDEIWPELAALIRSAGISDYSIFLDEETGILFGVQRRSSDEAADAIRSDPVSQRWEKDMLQFLEAGPDGRAIRQPLEEVFYLE